MNDIQSKQRKAFIQSYYSNYKLKQHD